MLVTGGNLDHSVAAGILTEKGGEELSVMMKNESGQVILLIIVCLVTFSIYL